MAAAMRLQRVLGGAPLVRTPLAAYALAVAAAAAALALRQLLDHALPPGFLFLTLFPAVILVAFAAGTGPGVLCALLCGLGSWYWFLPPRAEWALDGPTTIALGFYAFIVAIDLLLLDQLRRGLTRLAAEQETTTVLAERQTVMFQELQHRVANNMAFVASLLSLSGRRVADPAARAAVAEAERRVQVIGRIHRRLYDPAMASRPVGEFFREMSADLLEAANARNIVVLVDMAEMRFDVSRLTTLSLLVAELVTNSVKHAFDGARPGTIELSLKRLSPDMVELSVADDGRGLSAERDPASGSGLGTRIAQGLAAQLGGALRLESPARGGTAARVAFAA